MNIFLPAHRCLLALIAALTCAASVQAAVALRNSAELIEALKSQPPCCVVDARSEASQRKHPLADSVRYRPGLNIIPTASVVVVGDDDKGAARVGAALAKQHPGKTIFAVKGGATAWATVRMGLAGAWAFDSQAEAGRISFVIPHNTCENGTPLQILQSKTKP